MKIDYISDLHTDFYSEDINALHNLYSDGDILLVAGDLGNTNISSLIALNVMREHYEKIAIVLGNHDLYGQTNDRVRFITDECHALGIHLLNYNTVDFGDIVIGGGSCWCDFSYSNRHIDYSLYDYRANINDLHKIDYTYFNYNVPAFAVKHNRMFSDLEPISDVLLSHFGGKRETIAPWYQQDTNTDYFYWNGEHIQKPWVFGHQHTPYQANNIYVNPVGYPAEFNERKVQSFEI